MTKAMDGLGGLPPAALLGAATSPTPGRFGSPAKAAQQVEVEFLTQLLETMRRTVPEDELLPRSSERQVLDGAFDRTMATVLADSDPLGMVRALAPGRGEKGLKNLAQTAETNIGGSRGGRHEGR